MPCASDALERGRHGHGRFHHDHLIKLSNIYSEFKRVRGNNCPQSAGLQRLFHIASDLSRERTVVSVRHRIVQVFVQQLGEFLGVSASRHEYEGRSVPVDDGS